MSQSYLYNHPQYFTDAGIVGLTSQPDHKRAQDKTASPPTYKTDVSCWDERTRE